MKEAEVVKAKIDHFIGTTIQRQLEKETNIRILRISVQ